MEGRDAGTRGIYRIPECFGPSQNITGLKEVVFQDSLMSECPEVSRACQISMVMEEEKKDQHEHSCRRFYQRQLVSPLENGLLGCLVPRRHHSKLKQRNLPGSCESSG